MEKKYDLILFDLDGTLLDTSPGIFNSVRYTEEKMGFNKIPNEKLPSFVGPPPKIMYQEVYSVDEETAFQAVRFHREYGREKAIYEAEVYPGIVELLKTLKINGYKLGVATLKSQPIAESVLGIHGLSPFFDCIVGMDLNESLTKKDTVRLAMKRTKSTAPVLVGDSQYDYEGAVAAGIDFVGALYGFGIKEKTTDYPTIRQPLDLLLVV